MQPIVVLAVVGVVAIAMGTGFLANPIDLSMVQLIGVGETDFLSPIDKMNVDLDVVVLEGQVLSDGKTLKVFKNIIQNCIVESNDKTLLKGSKIFCKLTDENDSIVIEGMTVLQMDKMAHETFAVPINDPNGILNDVRNIHDIIIVILGPSQTDM